jgi:hypothetical protein
MVMPLPIPRFDAVQLVDDVVSDRQGGKNAAFFNSKNDEWRRRVRRYLRESGSPETVSTWPAIEPRKKSFLNLYLSPKEDNVHTAILSQLRKHNLTMCPACGEAGRPNTLDHYLPKNKYPHFCITPQNLFPMCDACQGKKGENTGDATDPRFFLHPYYDTFIGNQVLDLTIHAPFDKPTFYLEPAPDLPDAESRLVAVHVRELEVVERYGTFFRNEHRRLLRLVDKIRESGQDVEGTLNGFRIRAEFPSKNCWEHIFYSSVLNSPDFLNYLRNEELPELL